MDTKKISRFCISFILLFFAVFALSRVLFAQASPNEAYAKARKCYVAVKFDSSAVLSRKKWLKCADKFTKMSSAFPNTSRGRDGLFSAARLRREMYIRFGNKTDAIEAMRLYNRLIREYPKSSFSDDALYHIAYMRHKVLGQDNRARVALKYLIANYPKGDMVSRAKVLLSSLKNSTRTESKLTESASTVSVAQNADASSSSDSVEEKNNVSPFSEDVAGPFEGAMLSSIDISNASDSTSVTLLMNRSIPYSVEFTEQGRRTKSPPRLEIVLSYSKPSPALAKVLDLDSPYLKRIKLKKRFLESGSRVIFYMKSGSNYKVKRDGRKLIVSFFAGQGFVPAVNSNRGGIIKPSQDNSKKKS